jgi:hypothetical protein
MTKYLVINPVHMEMRFVDASSAYFAACYSMYDTDLLMVSINSGDIRLATDGIDKNKRELRRRVNHLMHMPGRYLFRRAYTREFIRQDFHYGVRYHSRRHDRYDGVEYYTQSVTNSNGVTMAPADHVFVTTAICPNTGADLEYDVEITKEELNLKSGRFKNFVQYPRKHTVIVHAKGGMDEIDCDVMQHCLNTVASLNCKWSFEADVTKLPAILFKFSFDTEEDAIMFKFKAGS